MTAFTIPAAQLADATAWAERIVPARPAVPVLSGVVIDTTGDALTLSAYDYDTAGTVTVDAAVAETGRVLVSAKLLAAVARAAPRKADIAVRVQGAQLWLTAGRSEWQLPLLPVEDYPRLPDLGDPAGTVDGAVLAEALGRVAPAAGRDDTLPMLTGVKVEADGGELTFTATDRFQLSTATVAWRNDTGALDVLVPASLLGQAVKAMDAGEVTVHAGGQGSGLSTPTHTVAGRLLDAQFPRWRALLAHDPDRFVDVPVAELQAALEQVAVYGDKTLRVDVGAELVVLSVAGEERAARADAPVAELRGEPLSVGVNPAFLHAALAAVGSGTARVFVSGELRPLLFTEPGVESHGFLVMPVRLPEAAA